MYDATVSKNVATVLDVLIPFFFREHWLLDKKKKVVSYINKLQKRLSENRS